MIADGITLTIYNDGTEKNNRNQNISLTFTVGDIEKEIPGIIRKDDGGFDISRQWYTDYKEFETTRDRWRSRIALDRLLFREYS